MIHIEHDSFTPLIMSVPGGMSRKLYTRLSEMISEKPDPNYGKIATYKVN